jgi:glycosyltransferase involved in cell wall biosynthesis
MRVCLLTPEFLPAWGGIGTYTYYLARGLQDHAEVHVVTSQASLEDQDLSDLGDVQVHALPSTRGGAEGVSSLGFQVAVWKHLPRIAREYGLDVVHANHAQMSDILARRRKMNAQRVLTVHTTLATQVEGTLQAPPDTVPEGVERKVLRHRGLLRMVERRYLRNSASIIFVSRWVRDHTMQDCGIRPRNSRVVHNAVDTEMFHPEAAGSGGRTDDPFTLLYAGRLLAQKGIGTLLEALNYLPSRVRLLAAGPGDPSPWRAYASRLGVPVDKYKFLGRVPYPAMPELYHRAHAFVLPSFTESCPMAALEAMACGTPLVAANVGGVSEIVRDGETGWLFPAGDPKALAARVLTVMQPGDAVRQVTERARTWVEANATFQRMAAETYQFYRSALGEANT